MRKLLFLSVVMSLIMSVNAQIGRLRLESVPMQRQLEENVKEMPFVPKIEKAGENKSSKPVHKSVLSYSSYRGDFADADGRVSNLAFSKNRLGALPDVNYTNMGYFTDLFPDTLAFRFLRNMATSGTSGKRTMFSSTGFVFDPYSWNFDLPHKRGLFEDTNGVAYGYRLDTLWTYVDYRTPKGVVPPDTLRFELAYFDAYTNPDTADYMIMTYGGYVLCPKYQYKNPIPQKGVGTSLKASQRTINYILRANDSILPSDGFGQKLLCIPIPNGFTVPEGAVLAVVATFIPGRSNYNLNDTLDILTYNSDSTSPFISQRVKENIFSIASWDFNNVSNVALYDDAGLNTFFMEDKAIRYKNPTTQNDTVCVNYSIYNPTYDLSPAFWMSLSVADKVDITSDIQGGNLVLSTDKEYKSYLWSTGATTRTITGVSDGGKYWVKVVNEFGANLSDTTTVKFEIDTMCANAQYDFHGRTLTTGGVYATTAYPYTYKIELETKPSPQTPNVTRNGMVFTSDATSGIQWWKNDTTLLAGATGQTYNWESTGAGKYSIVVTAENGCTAIGKIAVYSVNGRVTLKTSNPIRNLRMNNRGDSVAVTDYSGNYLFYVDGGSNVIVGPDTTNYVFPIKVRILNSIADNLQQNFNATEDKNPTIEIADIKPINPIRIYPNPTTGQLRIENGQLTNGTVEIFDIVGRKIVNCQLSTINSIDVSHLADGMYYLKIENTVLKFVKH